MEKRILISVVISSLICTSIFYLGSCKKEVSINQTVLLNERLIATPAAFDIYRDFTQPVDGMIGVQAYSTYMEQDEPNISYQGYIKENSETLLNVGNHIKMNDISLQSNENNFYSEQIFDVNSSENTGFGETTTAEFQDFSSSLYIPKLMRITSELGNQINIRPGFQINWEADENNNLGIVLMLEFDKTHPENKNWRLGEGKPIVRNFVYLPQDSGTYVFKDTDFDSFPLGASINVKIGRGGYKIVDWGAKKINLFGVSHIDISTTYN